MCPLQVSVPQSTLTRIIEGLTQTGRRDVLRVLHDASSISERELAREIATRRSDGDGSPDVERVAARLRHADLPKLAGLDLLDWNRSDERVSLSDHPIHDADGFTTLLEAGDADWNRAVAVHSDEDRRATYRAIASETRPTTRDALARAVVEDDSEAAVEQTAITLHHFHLPKLADVGLIEYGDDGTVVPTTNADVPWMGTAQAD